MGWFSVALRFHFDFISPYAYLAWTQIHALAARHGEEVEPVPALFAAMLGRWGHLGPAEIPPKRVYVIKNVARLAHALGAPIASPPAHPFNPLLALRVASVPMDPADRRRLIDGLYRAVWVEGRGVTDAAVVRDVITAAQLDADAVLARATSPEGKARLRQQTDAAVEAGVFGVPTILARGELFWGVDSLAHLEAFLEGKDPVDPELVRAWEELPAQASRRATPGPGGDPR